MKIELKKFQFFERMSEETNAFVADVYADGVRIASAKNDGHGGETYYYPDQKNGSTLEKAEQYCLNMPTKKYGEHEFKMNLSWFIDELVQEEIEKKEQKKMEKRMDKAIMWGVPKAIRYTEVTFKIPLSQIPTAQLQSLIDKYKKEFKEGDVFFNTNFEKLGIKI